MPTHAESRFLLVAPENVFDLVADIGSYPEFLPWCVGARILKREGNVITADLMVGFKMFRETFTSEVTLDRANRIDVRYIKGPMRHLSNSWVFVPRNGGTQVDFFIDFEFKSAILRKVMQPLFHEAVRRMVEAFSERAKKLYPPTPGSTRALAKLREPIGEAPVVPMRRRRVATPRAATTPSDEEGPEPNLQLKSTSSERIFGLGVSEYAGLALAPRIAAAMQTGIDLRILALSDVARQLNEDEIDLACWAFETPPEKIVTATLMEDSFVQVGNPRSQRHVLVPFEGYEALARLHPRRHIALTLPGFAALPAVLKDDADLVALIPYRAAQGLGLPAYMPSYATPPIKIEMAWHEKRDTDPSLGWLRARLLEEHQPLDRLGGTGLGDKPGIVERAMSAYGGDHGVEGVALDVGNRRGLHVLRRLG
jgi:coenzyme Q-binding protein COQ10